MSPSPPGGTLSMVRALADIAHLFGAYDESLEPVRQALQLLGGVVHYDRAAVLEVRPGEGDRFAMVPSAEPAVQDEVRARLSLLFDVVTEARDASEPPAVPLPGRSPHLAVPLIACDQVLGVLSVERGGEDYGEQQLGLLAIVGAQIAAFLALGRVTESERRRSSEVAAARAEAEAANRAKDEFLALLGHELRNPLSAVQNALHVAALDEGQRERALAVGRRQADQLARLIDDLLDVARIARGRVTLRKEPVSLADAVEHAVEATRGLVEARGHELTLSLSQDDVQVDADPARLEQIIGNLLTNAAKYTEPGGRIEVVTGREGGDAVLRVRDTGVGIAPEMLTRVFELFTQADRALDRAPGGLGIGLAVVRRLVELHGGRIEARSEGLGKGAELTVRLPALPPGRETHHRPAPAPPTGKESARVLVVEDNADAAESLSMLLTLEGHDVRIAENGLDALDTAQASVPDVMLVDIGLPGMDGYEVARRARLSPALQRVVLVALTGYGREEDKQQAAAAGFDHHLVKPVDHDTLAALLAGLRRDAGTSGSSASEDGSA